MIRTVNINVELSQVRLYLPEDFDWFDFGGTATRVEGEDDFVAGYVAYRTQQVEKLTQIIRGSNEFSKSGAMYNVEVLGDELSNLREDRGRRTTNEVLRSNLSSNLKMFEAATQEIQQLQQQEQQVSDNRDRLNFFYEQQKNTLSRNTVTRLEGNFKVPTQTAQTDTTEAPAQPPAQRFDQEWFDRSGPKGQVAAGKDAKADQSKDAAQLGARFRLQTEQSQRAMQTFDMPAARDAAQQVFQVQPGKPADAQEFEAMQQGRVKGLGTKEALNRAYADKFEKQVADRGLEGGQAGVQLLGQTIAAVDDAVQVHAHGGEAAGQIAGRAGLSSLDFELPTRGTAFYFTVPRGTVDVTARPIESTMRRRLVNLVSLLTIIIVFVIVAAVVRRLSQSRRGLIVAALFLCVGGLFLDPVRNPPAVRPSHAAGRHSADCRDPTAR